MALTPVRFSKPRGHAPRISEPYIPGKHDERFWTDAEISVIRTHFEAGGAKACLAHLSAHRSPGAVYQQARKLGLKGVNGGGPKQRFFAPPGIEETLRREWPLLDGKKKGEVAALADRLGIDRWRITKMAIGFGLTMPHRKEPPWTAAEDDLLRKVPLLDLGRCAKIFREHGFQRSPTAINVRATRLSISRRATRDTMSAREVAAILGIDSKAVTAFCIAGDLPATRREDKRSPQQGGPAWAIRPADLRQFIVDHIDRIDLRKVEKFAFIALLASTDQRKEPPCL